VTPPLAYRESITRNQKHPLDYDVCPMCGGTKHRNSKLCSACRFDSKRNILQPDDTLIRHISLTKEQIAVIDAKHYERISVHRYHAQWSNKLKGFYAVRSEPIVGGKDGKYAQATILMHREILGLTPDDPRTVDHIDPTKTLDNRECNLRIATMGEQKHNSRLYASNTSGYKGVYWLERQSVWLSYITVDKKTIYIGRRKTAESAFFELYVPAAQKYFGEFARLEYKKDGVIMNITEGTVEELK